MSVNGSKWSKSVSKCKSVSESDSTCQRVSVSISVCKISGWSVSEIFQSKHIHLIQTLVISKIVWLCYYKLLVSLYYVLIYAVEMLM